MPTVNVLLTNKRIVVNEGEVIDNFVNFYCNSAVSNTFGLLFKQWRIKSGFLTLPSLVEALEIQSLYYDISILSRWQTGDRIPNDRHLLLSLVKLFVSKGAVTSIPEANQFLESAGQGFLTESELAQISFHQPINSPTLTLEEEIDHAYQAIYDGYPTIAHQRLTNSIQYIKKSFSKRDKGINNLLSKALIFRVRSLNDITKKGEFSSAVFQAKRALAFSQEVHSEYVGVAFWAYAAIRRLQVITEEVHDSSYVTETLELALLANKSIPSDQADDKFSSCIELGKMGLLLNDQKLFDTYSEKAFLAAESLPFSQSYFRALAWDLQARGIKRFGMNTEKSFDVLKKAKSFVQGTSAVGTWIANTELDCLESSQDPLLKEKAKRLRGELALRLQIQQSPYQLMRFQNKSLSGM